jgi:hypothetical protein
MRRSFPQVEGVRFLALSPSVSTEHSPSVAIRELRMSETRSVCAPRTGAGCHPRRSITTSALVATVWGRCASNMMWKTFAASFRLANPARRLPLPIGNSARRVHCFRPTHPRRGCGRTSLIRALSGSENASSARVKTPGRARHKSPSPHSSRTIPCLSLDGLSPPRPLPTLVSKKFPRLPDRPIARRATGPRSARLPRARSLRSLQIFPPLGSSASLRPFACGCG